MKFSTKELVTLAVFGTLWGIVEISLGSMLKALNIPLSGVILSSIGLIIALIGRVFVPRRGSTLFVGIIATLLKLFSLGGVIIGPMVGIISEALVAEIVLSLSRKPRRVSFILAGSLGVLWVLVQPFVTGPLLFGRTFFTIWLDLVDLGGQLFGLDDTVVVWIVTGLTLTHMVIGSLAGWSGWNLGRQLQSRMGITHQKMI